MMRFYKKPFIPLINYFGQRVGERHFSGTPILIGGCGRSGTTLLLSILSAHPGVFACPRELGLFNEWYTGDDGRPRPTRIDRLHLAFLRYRIPPTAYRWCEKSPSNVRHIGNIIRYFNNDFKFIHVVRDGRDVVLSVHPTDKKRYWVEPKRWVNDVKAGLAYKDHPNVLTVGYETLITRFDKAIRQLCQFLDLPVTEAILNWYEHARVRKNRAYFSSLKQLHTRSIGKWKEKQYQDRVKEFWKEPGAESLMKELGYVGAEKEYQSSQ